MNGNDLLGNMKYALKLIFKADFLKFFLFIAYDVLGFIDWTHDQI